MKHWHSHKSQEKHQIRLLDCEFPLMDHLNNMLLSAAKTISYLMNVCFYVQTARITLKPHILIIIAIFFTEYDEVS